MDNVMFHAGDLVTPREAASLFGVDTKTVARWADTGKISCVRTVGGHRRYVKDELSAFLGVAAPDAPDET